MIPVGAAPAVAASHAGADVASAAGQALPPTAEGVRPAAATARSAVAPTAAAPTTEPRPRPATSSGAVGAPPSPPGVAAPVFPAVTGSAAAPTAPAAQAHPGGPLPGVASQLLSVLHPLRTTPGGAQTLTVLLHPENLGDVRATITSNGDQLVVRLAASTSEGTAAIRGALPELHSGLTDSGQRPTVLLADTGSFGQPSTGGGAGAGNGGGGYAPPAAYFAVSGATSSDTAPGAPAPRPLATDHVLDVRL